ncbi:MAG: SGNH/GDSL hydrolase family protein, partial [Verrucomicrobiota bacterium]|nr:SGNH/GDSL hydrolase family protein [Verrucomicrobiota bacterium]
MSNSFGSIGSLDNIFSAKEIKCKINGCKNTWTKYEDKTLNSLAHKKINVPDDFICERCLKKLGKLKDRQIKCRSNDCKNQWTWTKMEQLEAELRKHSKPPMKFCKDCSEKLDEISDIQINCRIKGCEKTWTWTKQAQLTANGNKPPSKMCNSCFAKLKTLRNKKIECKNIGCTKTWDYTQYRQLEDIIAGKQIDKINPKMCKDCFRELKNLKQKEIPCKINECKNTWTFSPYAQLSHKLSGNKSLPKRMCKRCQTIMKQVKPHPVQCKTPGCKNKWFYTTQLQLHDALTGFTDKPKPRLCPKCEKDLSSLKEIEVKCMHKGCDNTWLWSPKEQLKSLAKGDKSPPARSCDMCSEFLADTKLEEKVCVTCGKTITISPYEQLMEMLGNFSTPEYCSKCVTKAVKSNREKNNSPILGHVTLTKIPKTGPWTKNRMTNDMPSHIDHHKLKEIETSKIRILVFGDDLSFSNEIKEKSWPYLLQKILVEKYSMKKTVVINTSIQQTNSRHATIRFQRDVLPYKPHLIIFSFAHADAILKTRGQNKVFSPKIDLEIATQNLTQLCRKMKKLDAQLLYWVGNPMLPDVFPPNHILKPDLSAWKAQQLLQLFAVQTFVFFLLVFFFSLLLYAFDMPLQNQNHFFLLLLL